MEGVRKYSLVWRHWSRQAPARSLTHFTEEGQWAGHLLTSSRKPACSITWHPGNHKAQKVQLREMGMWEAHGDTCMEKSCQCSYQFKRAGQNTEHRIEPRGQGRANTGGMGGRR